MLFVSCARFIVFAFIALACTQCHGQAALLLEEPYGFFGTVNPTGHTAIFFSRICTETPVKLRRCEPGELGSVISRYQGINGYDWVAVPTIPYFYSVDTDVPVPERVTREQVNLMRDRYHEAQLRSLGDDVHPGNLVRGGWTQLLGTSYERRTYVFKFDTTPEQDDALIKLLNARPNQSRFNLFYNNCADFARRILNFYFPRTFTRSILPDMGMTTPKQITYKLVRYAHKHPEAHLEIFKVEQVPGYRRLSRANKSIAESLTTTAYAVPIFLLNPYLAGGIFVDYLARGRFKLVLRNPDVLRPEDFSSLTEPGITVENPASASVHTPDATMVGSTEIHSAPATTLAPEGIRITNE